MARIFIVDGAGARAGDLTTARERFDEANKNAFGADLDVHAHTPQNQIAGINALVATELGEELVRAALYGASIRHAPAQHLDALGSLLDIERETAVKSRVVARLSGVSGTRVPAGSLAKNSDGDTFESENDVTIRDNTASVGFVAIETGPKNVDPSTLTNIVTAISGWDLITNDSEGVIGRDKETDARYRANLIARTARSSIGSISALESALHSAGATRVRVLENTSNMNAMVSNVVIPGHSILVIADGGFVDDISRAVENHRGMGITTYTVVEGNTIDIAEAQKIQSGIMRFNNQTISGFDLSGQNINGMIDQLNLRAAAITSYMASYSNSGNRILTLHSWTPGKVGYEDVGGNISQSERILPLYTPQSADVIAGRRIRVAMPSKVEALASNAITVKYTRSGTETTATGITSSFFGNLINIYLPSAHAIASGDTDIKVSISSIENEFTSGLSFTDYPVTLSTAGASDAPIQPIVYGEPRNEGAAIWAFSLGTIDNWQYRRFTNGAYLDSNWVSIPASNYTTADTLTGTNAANGYLITGFTNGTTSRVDIRAVNTGDDETAAESFVFVPSNTAPAIQSQSVDRRLVTLTYNAPLQPAVVDSGLSQWTVNDGSANIAVSSMDVRGNKAYLRLASDVAVDDNATVACSTNTAGPVGLNNVSASTFTARALTNDAVVGVPSAPINPVFFRTSTGYKVEWRANSDGGLALDRYEVSTRASDTAEWSSWITSSASTSSYSRSTPTIPAYIRVRGSNPNVRAANILGLDSASEVYPFARSISRPLSVGITIHRDASITTDDFTAIKTSLVDLVNSYEIGSTIWQADFQARVESLASIRLASPLTLTSENETINGQAQNAYNRWTLSPDDISVTFQN